MQYADGYSFIFYHISIRLVIFTDVERLRHVNFCYHIIAAINSFFFLLNCIFFLIMLQRNSKALHPEEFPMLENIK